MGHWPGERPRPSILLVFSSQIICDIRVGSCAGGLCSRGVRGGYEVTRAPATAEINMCEAPDNEIERALRRVRMYNLNLMGPVERGHDFLRTYGFKFIPRSRILAR